MALWQMWQSLPFCSCSGAPAFFSFLSPRSRSRSSRSRSSLCPASLTLHPVTLCSFGHHIMQANISKHIPNGFLISAAYCSYASSLPMATETKWGRTCHICHRSKSESIQILLSVHQCSSGPYSLPFKSSNCHESFSTRTSAFERCYQGVVAPDLSHSQRARLS